MQVQCTRCNATLDVPAENVTPPRLQLQCRCGTMIPLAGVPQGNNDVRVSENGHSMVTAQPRAFRLVGEDSNSSSKETSPTPQAPTLRLVDAAPIASRLTARDDQSAAAPYAFTLRLVESQPVTHSEEKKQGSLAPPLRFASASEEHEGETTVAEAVAEVTAGIQRSRPAAQNKAVASMATPAAAPRSQTGKRRPGVWRQCVEHPQAKSETMCPACTTGYCGECKKSICPICDTPCIPASGYQKWLEQERLRARPMIAEIKTILAYPLQDPLAFFIFALITAFFSVMALFSYRAIIFSLGILLWYSFHTLYQVASGNLQRFIPEFNDVSDLTHPLRLSGAAMTITWGPLLLLGVLFTVNVGMGMNFSSILGGSPPAKEETVAAPPDEEDPAPVEIQNLLGDFEGEETNSEDTTVSREPKVATPRHTQVPAKKAVAASPVGTVSGVSLLLLLALLWKVAYTPVALIVAALSKNVMSVLNPLIGVDTIRRMGPVYWHVLLIYTGLTMTELGIGKIFGMIPIVGDIGMAFVKAYIAIAVGCALGLAVYKKAPELGWD